MYIKLILLFMIQHLIMISGEEIAVLFNNTILLDNSMITWDDFDILQCGVSSTNIDETSYFSQPTTITFSQTLLTTVQTEPNQISTSTPTTELNYSSTMMTTEVSTSSQSTTEFSYSSTVMTTEVSTSSQSTTEFGYSSTMMTTEVSTSSQSTTEFSYSSTIITAEVSTPSQSTSLYTCSNGYFGVNCDISSNICDITNPCFNGGICYVNNTLSSGYFCQCATGFSGYDCENDNRICTENTCWNNGTCLEFNTTISGNTSTSFTCQCISGYDGINCELEIDMCANITCENGAICASSYLTWSCTCLDSSFYSGTYCQDKSSSLIFKQALSKSLGIVAIIAICIVVGFVIVMDILKYVFKIDPVDRERHRLKMEQEKEDQKRFRKKKVIKKQIDIIKRFSAI